MLSIVENSLVGGALTRQMLSGGREELSIIIDLQESEVVYRQGRIGCYGFPLRVAS